MNTTDIAKKLLFLMYFNISKINCDFLNAMRYHLLELTLT